MPLPNIQNQIYGTLWLPYFCIDHDTCLLQLHNPMLQSNIKISNLKYEIAAPTNCCTKPVYKMVESRVLKLHMKKEEEKSGEKKKK